MMAAASEAILRILSAGPGATLQDGGRHGYLRFGVTAAGPMDPLAHATANLAVGNPAGATAIEVSVGRYRSDRRIRDRSMSPSPAANSRSASTAGRCRRRWLLNLEAGRRAENSRRRSRLLVLSGGGGPLYRAKGAGLSRHPHAHRLRRRERPRACRGRSSRHRTIRFVRSRRSSAIAAPWLDRPLDTIRVVLGPQHDYFADDQIAAFLAGPWTVSAKVDRMAYYLDGPRLTHARGYNIVSDGIAMGAIQVPGDGRPIVLMADRQSTGGYPKIATIIGPDLGRLAQARPGAVFRFAAVSIERGGCGAPQRGGVAGARHCRRAADAHPSQFRIPARPQSDRRCRRR